MPANRVDGTFVTAGNGNLYSGGEALISVNLEIQSWNVTKLYCSQCELGKHIGMANVDRLWQSVDNGRAWNSTGFHRRGCFAGFCWKGCIRTAKDSLCSSKFP